MTVLSQRKSYSKLDALIEEKSQEMEPDACNV
jgi:hypothetical protein